MRSDEPFCYVNVNKHGDVTRTVKRADSWCRKPLYERTQTSDDVSELTDAEISHVISASRFRVHGSMLEFSRELIAAHIAKQEQKS